MRALGRARSRASRGSSPEISPRSIAACRASRLARCASICARRGDAAAAPPASGPPARARRPKSACELFAPTPSLRYVISSCECGARSQRVGEES